VISTATENAMSLLDHEGSCRRVWVALRSLIGNGDGTL